MNKQKNMFTWGDAVLIKKTAPEQYRPGEFASICGIDQILIQEEADQLLCKPNDWIYIVEYEDGSSIEVPESFLEKWKQNNKFTWGDAVMVKKNVPAHLHPGEFASVYSVIKIDSKELEEDPSLVEPSWLYGIEFEDGSSIEISEYYLESYREEELQDKKDKHS